MIRGAHVILYSKNAEADRAFLRDVLGLRWVDAGHGWLIFALPPAEVAVHPAEENGKHELYFMCDGVDAEIARLRAEGVECSPVQQAAMGVHYAHATARRRGSRPLRTHAHHSDGLKWQMTARALGEHAVGRVR
jgi:catechol 2,3-dioxygenase-like lactoylglutathione lyase family enzyme